MLTRYCKIIAPYRKSIAYGLCLFMVVLYAKVISAYVLQGPHIIELMTEKLGGAKSLFVSQKVVFYFIRPQLESGIENKGIADAAAAANLSDSQQAPPSYHETDGLASDFAGENDSPGDAKKSSGVPDEQAVPPGETAFTAAQVETIQSDESLRYVFSEAFRSDSISDENQRIYVFRNGQTLTVIDGVISSGAATRFDLYKDLLLFRSREVLSERLSDLGIDISVSSLGKYEGRPAFVVGAEYPDETLPQVWIDIRTFQPLRMLIPSSSAAYSTDFLEIRYSQWQKIGKIWYPMRIEFIQDGATVREIEVNDYQVDPEFPPDVFDIARLKMAYRQPVPAPERPGKADDLSEVQKTIERFKKIFE